MSDMLSIGSSGISAYQRALATVSNNIANVNTEGYSRQDIQVASNQPRLLGGSYIGTGVRFDAVKRQYDEFIESNLRNSTSDLKAQEPLLSYVNRVIDIMGNANIGLTSALNQFFQSARDLSSDPASTVQRSIFLRDADGLASRYRQLSSQLETLSQETSQAVDTTLGQVNAFTAQLAQLNKQMSKHPSASQQPSELLDQRDLLLRNLSALINVKTSFADNGAVLVSVGDTIDQGVLVRDSTARAITVQPSATETNKLEFTIDAYGTPEGLPNVTSGQLGGILSFRDTVLNPAMNSLDDLAKSTVSEVNAIHTSGIDAEGNIGTNLFAYTTGLENKAAGVQLALQDASKIAAAGQFRVIDDSLNSGTAQARIAYSPGEYAGPTSLIGNLALAVAPFAQTETLAISATESYAQVGLIKAGTQDAVITLNAPYSNKQFQVLTRDGMHLLGSDLSSQALTKGWLMKSANGMEAGAAYNNSYLNASSGASYLDMDLFLGAKALPQSVLQFNSANGELADPLLVPAVLSSKNVPASFYTSVNKTGALTLNGVTLKPPVTPFTAASTTADLANWINTFTTTPNTANAATGVTAIINKDTGKLELTLANKSTTQDIRLGLGPNGTPADLGVLGFDTSIYAQGVVQDDLLVFVTDNSGSALVPSAVVSAQVAGVSSEMKQILRDQSLKVEFTSDTQYTITDTNTNTLLATRAFDRSGLPQLTYRGLNLQFSNLPVKGDIFRIDGNQDGIGNNENMMNLIALEDKKVMPGNLTLTESYIERVNQVGNVSRQASISKDALNVVFTQAKEARDSTSGVSLDEEASALVRFQQAYQANAKVMQMASQLFESILNVR
jgi:flagellar hook-associated protein FlgK